MVRRLERRVVLSDFEGKKRMAPEAVDRVVVFEMLIGTEAEEGSWVVIVRRRVVMLRFLSVRCGLMLIVT